MKQLADRFIESVAAIDAGNGRDVIGYLANLQGSVLQVDEATYCMEEVVKQLSPFVTEERLQRMDEIICSRSRHLIPVVEGVCDMGNISAVMRSAEAYGFFDFHIIQGQMDYFKTSKRTSQGAEKWLDITRHETATAGVRELKSQGYRILATHLSSKAKALDEVSFKQPTALVFGNEKDGISSELLALSDASVVLPMAGFTQSFNISVAAALCFHHVFNACKDMETGLAPHEVLAMKSQYLVRSIKHAKAILRRKCTQLQNDKQE